MTVLLCKELWNKCQESLQHNARNDCAPFHQALLAPLVDPVGWEGRADCWSCALSQIEQRLVHVTLPWGRNVKDTTPRLPLLPPQCGRPFFLVPSPSSSSPTPPSASPPPPNVPSRHPPLLPARRRHSYLPPPPPPGRSPPPMCQLFHHFPPCILDCELVLSAPFAASCSACAFAVDFFGSFSGKKEFQWWHKSDLLKPYNNRKENSHTLDPWCNNRQWHYQ